MYIKKFQFCYFEVFDEDKHFASEIFYSFTGAGTMHFNVSQ
jgi:hypothetical protein